MSINSYDPNTGKLTRINKASNTPYTNTTSGLSATTVQAAIDEVNSSLESETSARQSAVNMLQSNLSTEISARTSEDALINTRIDQIVAPTGEAPNPAEITDARIGADGVTYSTLGNAIREQNINMSDAINNCSFIENGLIDVVLDLEQGAISVSGRKTDTTDSNYSKRVRSKSYIPAVPYTYFAIKTGSTYEFRIMQYDSKFHFLSMSDWTHGNISVGIDANNSYSYFLLLFRNRNNTSTVITPADVKAEVSIELLMHNGLNYEKHLGPSSSEDHITLSDYRKKGYYAISSTKYGMAFSEFVTDAPNDLPAVPIANMSFVYLFVYATKIRTCLQELHIGTVIYTREISWGTDGNITEISNWKSPFNIISDEIQKQTINDLKINIGLGVDSKGKSVNLGNNYARTDLLPINFYLYNNVNTTSDDYEFKVLHYNGNHMDERDYSDSSSWRSSSFLRSPYVVIMFRRKDLAAFSGVDEIKNAYRVTIYRDHIKENIFGYDANIFEGLNIAIMGDSISTNGNTGGEDVNVSEMTITQDDVGVQLSAYPTYYDVQNGLSLGGHVFTSSEIGTEVTFTPIAADVGKKIGLPNNYNPNSTTVWWEVMRETMHFNPIPVCWSGSSITSHEDGDVQRKTSYAWHDAQIRKCGIRTPGSMNRTAPDAIIIYRGTNDFSHTPYTILSDGYFDNIDWQYPVNDVVDGGYGFKEGLCLTIKKLRDAYPSAKIFLCTLNVFKRINYAHYPTNNGINSLPQYNNAIREVADFMGCGIIEFDKDGITFENCYSGGYIIDSQTIPTHPSDKGHRVMGLKAIADMKAQYSLMT